MSPRADLRRERRAARPMCWWLRPFTISSPLNTLGSKWSLKPSNGPRPLSHLYLSVQFGETISNESIINATASAAHIIWLLFFVNHGIGFKAHFYLKRVIGGNREDYNDGWPPLGALRSITSFSRISIKKRRSCVSAGFRGITLSFSPSGSRGGWLFWLRLVQYRRQRLQWRRR